MVPRLGSSDPTSLVTSGAFDDPEILVEPMVMFHSSAAIVPRMPLLKPIATTTKANARARNLRRLFVFGGGGGNGVEIVGAPLSDSGSATGDSSSTIASFHASPEVSTIGASSCAGTPLKSDICVFYRTNQGLVSESADS